MNVILLIFFLLFAVVPLVLMIVALVDLLKRPQSEWQAAGQNQLLWGGIVVFVGVVGPILYLVMARPKLEATTALAA